MSSLEIIQENGESKDEAKVEIPFDRDVFSLISDVDPETGLSFAWLDIRQKLMDGVPPGDVLVDIFEYYQEKNPKMDAWLNFQLALSMFTKEELDGPMNRNGRKKLEQAVKKLIAKRSKKPMQEMNQFMFENQGLFK
jgi:hypothetical protein